MATTIPRREFLSAAALGSGAALAGVGCGAVALRPELGASETTALLSRLDRGLSHVRGLPFGALAGASPWQLRPDLSEHVVRLGIEAAVITDVARSIPRDRGVPRELAEALRTNVPILDECASTYRHLLATTPPAVRRNLDVAFRTEPEIAAHVAAYVETQGDALGISADSKARLRSAAAHIGARIRRQSMGAVIDDCIDKVDTVVARSGATLLDARTTATGAMIEAIWRSVDGAGGGGAAPPPPASYGTTTVSGSAALAVPTSTTAGGYVDPASGAAPASTEGPGDSELIIGGILMGAGVVVFGLGTLIGWALGADLGLSMMFAATPGSILLIIGLVLVIVGAVQNGRG